MKKVVSLVIAGIVLIIIIGWVSKNQPEPSVEDHFSESVPAAVGTDTQNKEPSPEELIHSMQEDRKFVLTIDTADKDSAEIKKLRSIAQKGKFKDITSKSKKSFKKDFPDFQSFDSNIYAQDSDYLVLGNYKGDSTYYAYIKNADYVYTFFNPEAKDNQKLKKYGEIDLFYRYDYNNFSGTEKSDEFRSESIIANKKTHQIACRACMYDDDDITLYSLYNSEGKIVSAYYCKNSGTDNEYFYFDSTLKNISREDFDKINSAAIKVISENYGITIDEKIIWPY